MTPPLYSAVFVVMTTEIWSSQQNMHKKYINKIIKMRIHLHEFPPLSRHEQ